MRGVARWSVVLAVLAVGAANASGAQKDHQTDTQAGPQPEAPLVQSDPVQVQVDWRTDLQRALKEAASTNRVVLVYFRADWSQPCRLVDRGSFGNRAMATYISRYFIPVRVDDTDETSPLSRKYAIRVYPAVLFLGPSGDTLHIVLGLRKPRDFLEILEKVRALPKLIMAQKGAPDDLEANFALGFCIARLDQLKRAAPYLERAAELDPENKRGRRSQAKVILAMAPLEDGDAAKALQNLDAYMQEFKGAPEIPLAIYWKGTVLYREGRLEEARKVFEDLTERFPRHRKAYEADKAIDAIDARLRAREVEKTRTEGDHQEKEPQPEG